MFRALRPSELGQHILILVENCPSCLAMLRSVVARLPNLTGRYFTLLDCCPTIYWEHGGGPDPDVRRDIVEHELADEKQFTLTQQYLEQARQILHDAGVPDSQVHIRTAIAEESYTAAAIAELEPEKYSGVMVSSQHSDIVHWLEGRGSARHLDPAPKVAVWAIDSGTLETTVA